MRIGNVAWSWLDPTVTPKGDQVLEIIDNIKSLGLPCFDMIGSRDAINNYYTDQEVERIRKHIDKSGLELVSFVSSTPDLNHPDKKERQAVLDDFTRAVDIGKRLGASQINTTVPRPGGSWSKPISGDADKHSVVYPDGYNFQKDWALFIESLKYCADITAKAGMKLTLECFAGSICSTPHSWLKIFDDVDNENIGIQLDTSHLVTQRYDVVSAIKMIPGRIYHTHMKDNDGMSRGNLPPGSGIVDYPEVIKALKESGFDGVLSIEVEFTNNPRRYVKQAKEHLEQVLAGEY